MADFSVVFDPMLDKERAEFDNGSGGSGGSSYVGGERINIAGGTISFVNSADIVNVTGTSVTLQPDTAYKIYATSQAITLNANPPAAGKWAYEGHLEIFTAGTGYVVTGTNVVLANALEPDSVNNCTVRFHDGIAIIAVEDHVAGYIVVNGSTAGDGSLAYGIATSTNDYVAFDASLNGTTIPLAGAVAEGEKHLVGNGYTETAITGAVNCGTSKFTVANLSLDDVQVIGGTMTLGDAYIPSGSTVAVSGGGLAVEHAKLDGTLAISSGLSYSSNAILEGSGTVDCTGYTSNVLVYVPFTLSGVTIKNSPTVYAFSSISAKDITFVDSEAYRVSLRVENRLTLDNCYIGEKNQIYIPGSGLITLLGSNTFKGIVYTNTGSGTVTLTSGAIVDLTGNTNATPIAPGGGITFEPGGATVYPSAGSVSAVEISGGTFNEITNGGVLNVTKPNRSNGNWVPGQCTLSGATVAVNPTSVGVINILNGTDFRIFDSVVSGRGIYCPGNHAGTVTLGGACSILGISDTPSSLGCSVTIKAGTSLSLSDSIYLSVGSITVEGACTVNGHTIAAGTYTSIQSTGVTVPPQA